MKSLSLKTVAVLCAAASAATIACAAMAQDGPPPGGPGGQFAQGPGGGGRGGGRFGGDPAQRMQQLHDQLQITAAQEPAFQTWQAALRPTGAMPRPGQLRKLTTPQRLDEELALQTQRDSQLKARVAATKSFYNQLSATQRQTMDGLPPQELLAMEAMGPGGGGRGLGGRGGRRAGGGFNPNGGFGGPQSFGGPAPQ